MRIAGHKALFLVLAGAASMGCATPPLCDALNKCGGDFYVDSSGSAPSKKWTASGNDACVDQVPNAPTPPSAALVPPRPAGVRAIEPSTLDWCAGLVTAGDGTIKFDDGWFETLQKYSGWFPSVPLAGPAANGDPAAVLEFVRKDQQYTLTTRQDARQTYELSKQCLVAQGTPLSCSALADQIKASVEKNLGNIEALKGTGPDGQPRARVYYAGGSDKPSCVETTDGGCNCDYYVSLTTTTTGPYSASNSGQINFFDAKAGPPVATDYCASASSLSLSGDKSADLFNRTSLKTLKLSPAQ